MRDWLGGRGGRGSAGGKWWWRIGWREVGSENGQQGSGGEVWTGGHLLITAQHSWHSSVCTAQCQGPVAAARLHTAAGRTQQLHLACYQHPPQSVPPAAPVALCPSSNYSRSTTSTITVYCTRRQSRCAAARWAAGRRCSGRQPLRSLPSPATHRWCGGAPLGWPGCRTAAGCRRRASCRRSPWPCPQRPSCPWQGLHGASTSSEGRRRWRAQQPAAAVISSSGVHSISQQWGSAVVRHNSCDAQLAADAVEQA